MIWENRLPAHLWETAEIRLASVDTWEGLTEVGDPPSVKAALLDVLGSQLNKKEKELSASLPHPLLPWLRIPHGQLPRDPAPTLPHHHGLSPQTVSQNKLLLL